MKKILITSISSMIVLSLSGIGYTATKLTEKDKNFFYTTLFSDINTDMFNNKANPLEINGKKLGEFKSGTTGITVYLSIYQTFSKFSKLENLYEDELIGKYAGVTPYSKENKADSAFKYYNPDFIKWGIDNLYISPETEIYGVKAKDIYNKSFQRYFRLTAESYLYLNKKKGLYKAEQKKYIDSYNKSKDKEDGYFEGIDYLKNKFDNSLKSYNQEEYSYTPGIAVGFWLRRGIDKTDKTLWSGLKKIMINYDNEWFKKVSR